MARLEWGSPEPRCCCSWWVSAVGVSGCKVEPEDGAAGPEETAAGGAALTAVDSLTVKGRAPKTGYDREKFGTAWADTDSNELRHPRRHPQTGPEGREVQRRRLQGVLRGTRPGPYTGKDVTFTRGRSKVDIDHVVALSDAWQKGAKYWDASKRIALANDPLNLRAVDSSTNRSKGDGDTATWLPPNKAYRCTYVAAQVAVKKKYELWVTSS